MRQTVNDLIEVIKNPDFDRFEYLKYLKLDNQNLTCLANKTIHILPTLMSTKMIENIVLISSVDISLKVAILFGQHFDSEFWEYYLKKNKLLDIENLKIGFRLWVTLDGIDQDSNDLYIIDERSSEFVSVSYTHLTLPTKA